MITRYNLDFDIVAVIIMLLEMIYVRVQYSHDKYSSRLFIMLLHSSLLLGIVDILSSMMLDGEIAGASRGVVKFTCSFYYLVSAFTIMIFYRYIVEYLGIKFERTVSYYVVTYFPFIFCLECLVANCYGNILFSGGKYGYFSYGPLIVIIYYYPVYYFVLTIVRLIQGRHKIERKKYLPIFAYMICTTISVVVQFLSQNIMIVPFGFAISLLVMMLSLETPDYKRLIKTTELLEAVRGEFDYQSEINETLISEIAREVCVPMEKLLEKNKSFDLTDVDDEYAELHEYVNGYSEIVCSVIDNVFEFNSLGKTAHDVKTQEYNIKDLVCDVQNIMMPAIKDTANSISHDIAPEIPDRLIGAPELLRQIMINLICQSIENTQNGAITVKISGRRIETEDMNLIISVEDNGRGLSRDTVRKILQFNTKASKWNKEIFNGGYFKIRIAKRMIERMHGKLHIDSDIEKGSRYTVVLPQRIAINK